MFNDIVCVHVCEKECMYEREREGTETDKQTVVDRSQEDQDKMTDEQTDKSRENQDKVTDKQKDRQCTHMHTNEQTEISKTDRETQVKEGKTK